MDIRQIPLELIDVSSFNTRKNLGAGGEDASLDDLAASIREVGLLNPVQVRARADSRYELISGQRRLLAFRKLGRSDIAATVVDVDDAQALSVSLVENVQRSDMDPLDKARAFGALQDRLGSLESVSRQTGVAVRTIRRYLALLRLPPALQEQVSTRTGPAGVGAMSELATRFNDPSAMVEAFGKVKGFTGGVAEEILRRSGGDLGAVEGLVDRAIAGEFERFKCGTNLETCPYIPDAARPLVRQLIESTVPGSAGLN